MFKVLMKRSRIDMNKIHLRYLLLVSLLAGVLPALANAPVDKLKSENTVIGPQRVFFSHSGVVRYNYTLCPRNVAVQCPVIKELAQAIDRIWSKKTQFRPKGSSLIIVNFGKITNLSVAPTSTGTAEEQQIALGMVQEAISLLEKQERQNEEIKFQISLRQYPYFSIEKL